MFSIFAALLSGAALLTIGGVHLARSGLSDAEADSKFRNKEDLKNHIVATAANLTEQKILRARVERGDPELMKEISETAEKYFVSVNTNPKNEFFRKSENFKSCIRVLMANRGFLTTNDLYAGITVHPHNYERVMKMVAVLDEMMKSKGFDYGLRAGIYGQGAPLLEYFDGNCSAEIFWDPFVPDCYYRRV